MKVHGAPWTFMRLVSAFIYTKMFYKSPWKSMDNINREKISVWTCVDLCGLGVDFAWTLRGLLIKVHGRPWTFFKANMCF